MTDLERVRDDHKDCPEKTLDGPCPLCRTIDAHEKEDAAEQMKLGGYVNLVKKLEAELAKLRERDDIIKEQLDMVYAERDRLREDLKQVTFARADAALKVRLENENAKLRGKHEVLREKYVLVHAERDRLRENLYQAQRQVKVSEAELARLRPMEHKYADALEREAVLDIENARLRDALNAADNEKARLREVLEQVTANRDSLLLRVEETEDDCRRLREDRDKWKTAWELQDHSACYAENATLRAQVDQLAMMRGKQIPALWAENDRLRENYDIGAQNYDDLKEDYTELLEAVKAAMNVWYDGPIWPKPYDNEIAEVKRLRKLIEEQA